MSLCYPKHGGVTTTTKYIRSKVTMIVQSYKKHPYLRKKNDPIQMFICVMYVLLLCPAKLGTFEMARTRFNYSLIQRVTMVL
jgi:hypothetical protein